MYSILHDRSGLEDLRRLRHTETVSTATISFHVRRKLHRLALPSLDRSFSHGRIGSCRRIAKTSTDLLQISCFATAGFSVIPPQSENTANIVFAKWRLRTCPEHFSFRHSNDTALTQHWHSGIAPKVWHRKRDEPNPVVGLPACQV